jgi:hypothetical protein
MRLLRDAALTFVAVLLAFAAFDDITTGREPDFTTEYVVVLACAGVLLLVSIRLLRSAHQVLGGISLLALAGALWSQRAVGPGLVPGLRAEYVVAASALLWFAALSLILLVLGWRAHPDRVTGGSVR